MPSSSSETVRFTRRLADARIGAQDGRSGEAPGRFGMKEIQRRAYERGVEVERRRFASSLSGMIETVTASVRELEARAAADRAEIAEFATRLGLAVAEKILVRAIDEAEYDIPGIVAAMLEEIGARGEARRTRAATLAHGPRHAARSGRGYQRSTSAASR